MGKGVGSTDALVPTVKLKLKVIPGAKTEGVVGWLGDALKVRVTAPPEHGKANAAVECLVCEVLSLPRGAALIVAGKSSSRKVAEISGLTQAELRRRLETLELGMNTR